MTLREQAFAGRKLDCFIVDAHTHLTEYFLNAWHEWPKITGIAESLTLFDRLGVDCLVTAPHMMVQSEMGRANETAARAAEEYPGRIYGYISVCPGAGLQAVKEQLNRYAGNPAFVGMKFLGGYHGSYTQREYLYALDLADEMACPVLCHTYGGNPPLSEFEAILNKARRLSLITAHLGGGSADLAVRAAKIANDYENFYMETCGALPSTGSNDEVFKLVGAKKIIFGTDMINLDPKYDFGKLAFSRIPDEEKREIFAGNFIRLTQSSQMGKIKKDKE